MQRTVSTRYHGWLLTCAIVLAIGSARSRGAEPPRPGARPDAPSPALDTLVKRLVIEHAPRFVEKSDGWGRTKEIVSGLDVRLRGGELRTHRRHKQVNDGTWKWYRCELPEPQRDLDIHITPRADASDGAKQFDVSTTARVKVQARWQRWESGVRLASVSAEAKALVRLDLGCRVKLELDTCKFPPDLVVTPRVERAEVRLLEFDLDHVSVIHGDLADELGRVLRPTIEREIARRQGELLPKLNALLAARQSDLRFSLTSWVSKGWLQTQVEEKVDASVADRMPQIETAAGQVAESAARQVAGQECQAIEQEVKETASRLDERLSQTQQELASAEDKGETKRQLAAAERRLAEGQQTLGQQIVSESHRVEKNARDLIREQVENLTQRSKHTLQSLNGRIDNLDGRSDALEFRLCELEAQLTRAAGRIAELEKPRGIRRLWRALTNGRRKSVKK